MPPEPAQKHSLTHLAKLYHKQVSLDGNLYLLAKTTQEEARLCNLIVHVLNASAVAHILLWQMLHSTFERCWCFPLSDIVSRLTPKVVFWYLINHPKTRARLERPPRPASPLADIHEWVCCRSVTTWLVHPSTPYPKSIKHNKVIGTGKNDTI